MRQDGVNDKNTFIFVWLIFIFSSTCLHMTDLDHCGMSVSEVVVQMRVVVRYVI